MQSNQISLEKVQSLFAYRASDEINNSQHNKEVDHIFKVKSLNRR